MPMPSAHRNDALRFSVYQVRHLPPEALATAFGPSLEYFTEGTFERDLRESRGQVRARYFFEELADQPLRFVAVFDGGHDPVLDDPGYQGLRKGPCPWAK